ncbi:MAG: L,D-transpeptidase family protein [Pseudolabrys sp.]
MTYPVARALLATAAIAAAVVLSACNKDDITPTGRAMAPLSPQMVSLIKSKGMDKNSAILVRVFKQESELEVWKKNRDGKYALLKTYPICRWSGDLGPKKKEGDRQAPEGFYTITPGQMNPNSHYYLAFNTGYPNAYDRAHGRTGSELMVHGDCSSRGCFAMTDEQILEIYALARDAFFGGQREFQFEAFPFRMTALNMAKHRNNPNFKFWKMLKQGYDDFEATHQEPKVAVCNRRYVFDAAPPPGHKGPLYFNPRGKCPVYQLDPSLAPVITAYRRQQEIEMANYIARGVAVAPPHKGDGGTNPVFAADLAGAATDNNGHFTLAGLNLKPGTPRRAPGALPHVPNPPGTTIPEVGAALVAKKKSAPQPASQPVRVASVPLPTPAPQPKEGRPEKKPTTIASLIGKLFSQPKTQSTPAPVKTASADADAPVHLRGSKATTDTELTANPKHTAHARSSASAPISPHPAKAPHHAAHRKAMAKRAPEKPAPKAVANKTEPAQQHKTAAKAEPARTASAWPPPQQNKPASAWPSPQPNKAASAWPSPQQKKPAQPEPQVRTAFATEPASNDSLLTGAQPVMPAGSFKSR